MKVYKLTNQDGRSRGDTQWGEGVTLELPVRNTYVTCSSQVLHAYVDPVLALLLNPIHSNFSTPLLWEAYGEVVVSDWDKIGCRVLTTAVKLDLPTWYQDGAIRTKVQIAFAVLCAKSVLHIFEELYPNDKRPRLAIEAAKNGTYTAREAAREAAWAAAAATWAAPRATWAARAAAWAAAWAAPKAAEAAKAAAWAEAACIDLPALALQAAQSVTEVL